MRSILLSGIIAPLAAPALFFLSILLIGVFHDGPAAGLRDWNVALLLAMVFVLPVSYLATWAFGVPYIFWLRSRSRLTTLNVCSGALVLGVASAWAYQWIGKAESLQMPQLAFGAALGAGLALCVAITFCVLAGTSSKGTT